MTQIEEQQIIKQVLGGDRNAFEQLVMANQTNVYNLALKMTRNKDDALDISQEAFIKAYRNLPAYRAGSRFSVWLYKITYNLCIDHHRKNAHMQTVPLDFDSENDEDTAKTYEIPDLRNLPEDSIIRRELRKSIAEGINHLPHKLREVLILREIADMSYEEIAETIRLNPGTVKSRLSRARLRLLKILDENGTIPEEYRLKITQPEIAQPKQEAAT